MCGRSLSGSNEKGFVLAIMPYLILAFVTLLWFLCSIGYQVLVRHMAQSAADAAALAGASNFKAYRESSDPWDWTGEVKVAIDPVQAEAEARSYLERNSEGLKRLVLNLDPVFEVVDDRTYRVTLNLRLKPLFDQERDMTVVAVAHVENP